MKVRVGILTAPHIEYEQRGDTFAIKNVRIGIGFHWDRYEEQVFEGELEIITNPENGMETAVNIIEMEDYLTCVISSEMSADSPMELLKAHAVISRSWLMSTVLHNNSGHLGYDVCADDHCQRYEGILRRNPRAIEAVRATKGEVLVYERKGEPGPFSICDTRYHKCCGGKTENYETCWENIHIPYLTSVSCPYCGKAVGNERLIRMVLNNYDQETQDFHDWTVQYTQAELSEIIRQKSGIDFGDIIDLVPLKRGASGRIYSLDIVGTKEHKIIGKELKIRLWLSRSCLYSSAFKCKKQYADQNTIPSTFVLHGKGWGHGVGLCQIGAAVMADAGSTYTEILAHYYKNAQVAPLASTYSEEWN